MKYLTLIGSSEPHLPEAVEEMLRAWPGYLDEMRRREVWQVGRPLELPDSAATVRVRDGETLVADGPFIETKEFIGGIDLLECADLDEAIELKQMSPIVKLNPFEIRPFPGVRLGACLPSFDPGGDLPGCRDTTSDESGRLPHLLLAWTDGASDERAVEAYDAWQQDLDARGLFVLGGALEAPETATTLRYAEGRVRIGDGPLLDGAPRITAIDAVSVASHDEALALAAEHPLARSHVIEVRPFLNGGEDDAEEPAVREAELSG